MYQRHSKVTNNSETYTYWRLVRSVLHGPRVGRETLAYLGAPDTKEHAQDSTLARQLLGQRADQLAFFDDRSCVELMNVRVEEARLERRRRFADAGLGWLLWRALELDRFRQTVFPRGREIAAVLRTSISTLDGETRAYRIVLSVDFARRGAG